MSKPNHRGTLVYSKMKNCSDLHRFYFMSKCHIYIYIYKTFHFLLTHEKRGISKQSLVLRHAEATPTFNIFPFFILMLLCQSQAVSVSYGVMKLHHIF